MNYPKDWDKVTCNDWCEDERRIWLSLINKNAICEIDKSSKNVKILGYFPHNGLGEDDLSLSVEKCENYVIFCPFKAKDIGIFNISTEKLEFINVAFLLDRSEGIELFYRMIVFKKNIFFLGIRCPVIMRLDLETRKIDLFDDWLEKIEQQKCNNGVYFTDGYAQRGNELYLPIGRCSGILKVNLDKMNWDYIKLNFGVDGILGMVQNENLIWFTANDKRASCFFQWDLDNNKVVKIELPYQGIFYAPLYYEKSLFFFGNSKQGIYQYELESKKWKDITSITSDMEYFSPKKGNEKGIDYFSNKSKKFYHWNLQTNVIYCNEFQIKETRFLENSWIDYCKRRRRELRELIVLEGKLTINDYIDIINTNIT